MQLKSDGRILFFVVFVLLFLFGVVLLLSSIISRHYCPVNIYVTMLALTPSLPLLETPPQNVVSSSVEYVPAPPPFAFERGLEQPGSFDVIITATQFVQNSWQSPPSEAQKPFAIRFDLWYGCTGG